jgi:hypothetical protein
MGIVTPEIRKRRPKKRAGGVAEMVEHQAQGPEFKPEFFFTTTKKKEKRRNRNESPEV